MDSQRYPNRPYDTTTIHHLFKMEYSKLVAVLTKSFGMVHMDLAEDITSETFFAALNTWPYKGIPANPTAWLYTVAKNKAKNHLARDTISKRKIADTAYINQYEETNIDFSDNNIADSQLQMLFAICHPAISPKAQISLALRILGGLGLDEIADAFLTTKETINKRLQRAKKKLKVKKVQMTAPGREELKDRLDNVLHTLYLLFSEGYYSESNTAVIRKELCLEAMNLAYLVLKNPVTNTHASNSLMALMSFQASRLEARIQENGHPVLYQDQEENKWDKTLIEKGFFYLQQASKWEIASKYYVEASIAYWHTIKSDSKEKWESILKLYDLLLKIEYTPLVALNRIMAFAKVKGREPALLEARKLNLTNNHFYYLIISELSRGIAWNSAEEALQKALEHCKNETEIKFIKTKLQKLKMEINNVKHHQHENRVDSA